MEKLKKKTFEKINIYNINLYKKLLYIFLVITHTHMVCGKGLDEDQTPIPLTYYPSFLTT